MKVGFIGLGSMGYGQAILLANSAHELTVFDVVAKATKPFEGKANIASNMAELASGAEVIGVCVRDDAQVNECVDALLPVMEKNSVLLIHSTVKPATMKAAAQRGLSHDIHVLDASVTRTRLSQDAPFVYCMLAGDEAAAKRVEPVLEAFSTDTIYVGEPGAAMAMKISNNLVSWGQIMLGLEAFKMAEAAGVPTDKLLAVMQKNGVLTPPMAGFIDARSKASNPDVAEMLLSQAGIGEKDLSVAEALAAEAGVTTPIGSFIRGRVVGAIDDVVKG